MTGYVIQDSQLNQIPLVRASPTFKTMDGIEPAKRSNSIGTSNAVDLGLVRRTPNSPIWLHLGFAAAITRASDAAPSWTAAPRTVNASGHLCALIRAGTAREICDPGKSGPSLEYVAGLMPNSQIAPVSVDKAPTIAITRSTMGIR